MRPGQRNAPARTRNINTIQAAEHTSAAVTGACDDSTSEPQPSAKIIVAGDVKGGQPCCLFTDTGQNYWAGMFRGDLVRFPALRDVVRDYKDLECPLTVRTAGDSVAFYVVAQGVIKFNFYFGSPAMRWLIVELRVNFIDQEQRLIPQSDLPRVTIGAQFLRSFAGGTMCTDGIKLIWTPGPKCKKDAENDRLGTFHNHNLPCELRDADPHERDRTGTLDDEQIAEWRRNQGDELSYNMPNLAELRSIAGPNRFVSLTEDKGLVSAATFEGATLSEDLSGALDTQVLDNTAAQGRG